MPQLQSPHAEEPTCCKGRSRRPQLRPGPARYDTFAGHHKQNRGSRSGCHRTTLVGLGVGTELRETGDLRRVHCRPREQRVQSPEGGWKESEVPQRLEWLARVCGGLPRGAGARQGPGHAGFTGRGEPRHFVWCDKSWEVLISQAMGSSLSAV